MDADLQDDPSEILPLYSMIKENKYDLVSGWKKKRNDPLTKLFHPNSLIWLLGYFLELN